MAKSNSSAGKQSVYEAIGIRYVTIPVYDGDERITIDTDTIPAGKDPWRSLALEAMSRDPAGGEAWMQSVVRGVVDFMGVREAAQYDIPKIALRYLGEGLSNTAYTVAWGYQHRYAIQLSDDPWAAGFSRTLDAFVNDRFPTRRSEEIGGDGYDYEL